ncbi:MAG: FAD-binding protein [Solirubrobacteraceae bacterium]
MKKKIANWGNYPIIQSEEFLPNSQDEVIKHLKTDSTYIARGNGRCYGDANLNENTVSTLKLNHFIFFDENKGILECESGVLLSNILDLIIPKGFFIPVTPGTKFITIGGAIATDVHGKNHHVMGCFSNHVEEITLIDSDSLVRVCSPSNNQELFWATIGGMGLTGIITKVKFKLIKIESAYIKQESIKAKNLDEIFDLFEKSENHTYTVAWIDCLQTNKSSIGRSILMRGEHATKVQLSKIKQKTPLLVKQKLTLNVPFMFPSFVLNNLTVKIFNFLFYNKQLKKEINNIIDYDTFFYPLDSINNWNKIYGKNGFIQYQFVIPKEMGRAGMEEILIEIAKSKQGSFLAVLKLFGKNNALAYNSFPIEGYTLALDFKVTKALPNLVRKLDELVEKYNGRIYRAKDSMSKSSLLNYLKNVDSEKFNSIQNKRINKIN